jgi:nucleotide-binding universal stress UspA family protein
MYPMKLILHPTDFSEHSRHALNLACALAQHNNARVLLAHVVTLPPPPPQPYNEAGLASYEDINSGEIDARMAQIRAEHPNIEFEEALSEGKPAIEILRIARESNCDAIVIGTHGRSGLGRLLMGSVAEKIVREASCPVITVKAPVEMRETREQNEVGTASQP